MGTLRWGIPAGQQERYPPTPAAVGEYGASSKREMRAVAAGTGMELLAFDAAGPDDYPSAFAAMRAAGGAGPGDHVQPHLQSRRRAARQAATIAAMTSRMLGSMIFSPRPHRYRRCKQNTRSMKTVADSAVLSLGQD